MPSKYVDMTAIAQVIGCVFSNPHILDNEEKYSFSEEDFSDEFHKILFGTIYKLYNFGVSKITLETISDYLSSRDSKMAIYKTRKGEEYLLKAQENSSISTFDYYYNRLKKMTLLRAYDNFGLDVSFLYDPDNIMDIKKKQIQEDWFDNTSLEAIADAIDEKISSIRETFVDDSYGYSVHAGVGAKELKERLKNCPEIGIPLYGTMINTVTRGARLSKFYLRSAPTGIGKSRSMIADACNIACNEIYDKQFGWIKNGTSESTLYISTEQQIDEIQTMMWAFLADVDEDHILYGKYENDEEERVDYAIELLEKSPLYIELLPDFSLKDVENTIKRNVRERQCSYVFHDYIHSSLKILEEVSKRTKGMSLREDNILFMLSTKLKDICNQYGIFLMSATQLSADWKTEKTPDQNLLRGAKAIADKIDYGSHILPVNEEDIIALQPVLESSSFNTPLLKISVYKNRRGKYRGMYLWCDANLGACRITPLFATSWSYDLISIDNLKISVLDEEGAFA